MAFLTVRGLSVQYDSAAGPVYALDDVDFELEEGQSMGIAGESACGKSTLGLSLIRALPKDADGVILFDGRPILDMPESEFDSEYRWKQISMIFQGAMNSLDPVFTIQEQFAQVLRQHGQKADHKSISDALHSASLDDAVLKRYPHELSGGMKQRVIIAMALVLGPKLVIADEPTTALDVLIQAQIINLLKRLKGDGTSFVLITHDLAVLSEISDVIGVMYGGKLVEFGSAKEIYSDPKHPYTQELLKSIPTLRGAAPGYIKGSPPSLLEPPEGCRFLDRCPHAMDKCRQPPPKTQTRTGYVRCWLY